MSDEESVTDWLLGLKQQHPEAAGKLWKEYMTRLIGVARHKLKGCPRKMADEEDVVLSVFDAFLRGVQEQRFPKLDDREDLWQVLVMLTERRAIALRRHEFREKRGGGKVRGESALAQQEDSANVKKGLDHLPAPEVTPAFANEMESQLRDLLELLSDDLQRQIAVGKLEGFSNEQLAERFKISLRTVTRKLGIIRDKWTKGTSDD